MITLGLGNIVPTPGKPSQSAAPDMVRLDGVSTDLLRALSETIKWCSSEAGQRNQLRSRELNPSTILEVPFIDEIGVEALVRRMRESYQQAVSAINAARSALLHDSYMEVTNLNSSQFQGRLLFYEPLETVTCGASEASSHGFFDGRDAPPWDTWFLYSGGTIFSWVPDSLVGDAQAGIDANPVDCIHWGDWLPTENGSFVEVPR